MKLITDLHLKMVLQNIKNLLNRKAEKEDMETAQKDIQNLQSADNTINTTLAAKEDKKIWFATASEYKGRLQVVIQGDGFSYQPNSIVLVKFETQFVAPSSFEIDCAQEVHMAANGKPCAFEWNCMYIFTYDGDVWRFGKPYIADNYGYGVTKLMNTVEYDNDNVAVTPHAVKQYVDDLIANIVTAQNDAIVADAGNI